MRIDIFKLKYFQDNEMIVNKYDKKYISLKNIDNMIIKYYLMICMRKYFIIDKNDLSK